MAAVLEKLPAVRVGRVDVTRITKETLREMGEDDVPGLAAEMTYHAILAVFPFLLLLAGLTSVIDTLFNVPDLTDRIIDKASQVMPEDAISVLRSFTTEVVRSKGAGAIAFGLFGSLWAASAAMSTAMKALSRVYDVKDDRNFFKKRAISLGLTLLFGGLLLAATALALSGALMAGGIGRPLGWSDQFVTAWNIVTPILAILLVMLAVAVLYWLAPNAKQDFKWVTPGALLFIVGWILFSVGFTLYISNFASYNRVYGSLTAVIILLIWMYWSNMLLLTGAQLNAVLAKRFDDEYKSDPKTPPPGQS